MTHETESSLTVIIIGKIFRNGCICVCYLLLAAELCLGILNVNISHPIFVPSITQSYNIQLQIMIQYNEDREREDAGS